MPRRWPAPPWVRLPRNRTRRGTARSTCPTGSPRRSPSRSCGRRSTPTSRRRSATALNAYDKAGDTEGRNAYLKAFGTNLALNTAWSVLFWRVRKPWVAAAEAALLTASSADLARRAGTVSKGAGIALSPYAVWCGFATALSTAIARRNR